MDGASFRSKTILSFLKNETNLLYALNRSAFEVFSHQKMVFFFRWFRFQCKTFSALKAFLLSRHYIQTKHVGFLFCFLCSFILLFLSPSIVYIHFLWSYPYVRLFGSGKSLVIDTHNYDPDWWDNLEASSKWPWEKYLCRLSKKRIFEILRDLPKNTILVHVSKEDSDKYRLHRPDLTHLILPNGCNLQPRTTRPDYAFSKKKIYFLGALNLQITRDAILHFCNAFWPQLSTFCEFHLIGSGPAGFWRPFCRERGWHLHNNVPDDDLTHLLEGMHYLVLPFTYGAGSKLKFIDACARGISVISTPPGVCGFSNLPPTVRISEDPQQWASWIASPEGPTPGEISACLDFAKEYSWDNLVAKVWPQIVNHPPVP